MKKLLEKLPRWFPIVFAAVIGMTFQFFISSLIGNMMGLNTFASLRAISLVFVCFGVLLIAELAGILVSDHLIHQDKLQAAQHARIISYIAVGFILAIMLVLIVILPSIPMRILYISVEIYSMASEMLSSAGLSFMIVTLSAFFVGNVVIRKESQSLTLVLSAGLLFFFCILASLHLWRMLTGWTTLRSTSYVQGVLFACSLVVPFALMPLRTPIDGGSPSSSKRSTAYSYLEEYKRNHR